MPAGRVVEVGIPPDVFASQFPDLAARFPETEINAMGYDYQRLATIGAMCILDETHQIMTGTKPGNLALATEDYHLMSAALQQSLHFFRQWGWTGITHFFNLNGQPLFDCPDLEPTLVDWPVLRKALGHESYSLPTKEPTPETDKSNVYIATVGLACSGKGSLTWALRARGFLSYPLSDRVREMAAAYGHQPPYNRDILIGVGQRVKSAFDAGVLIRAAINMYTDLGRPNKLLFDGLRTVEEADQFLALGKDGTRTILIAITTGLPPKEDRVVRFRRAILRGGPKDPKNNSPDEYTAFCRSDSREMQGILNAMAKATHVFVNPPGITENALQGLLAELGL